MKVIEKHLDIMNGVEYYGYTLKVEIPFFVDLTTEDYQKLGLEFIEKLEQLSIQKEK